MNSQAHIVVFDTGVSTTSVGYGRRCWRVPCCGIARLSEQAEHRSPRLAAAAPEAQKRAGDRNGRGEGKRSSRRIEGLPSDPQCLSLDMTRRLPRGERSEDGGYHEVNAKQN